MLTAGRDEKIHPVGKIAVIVDALSAEGVSPLDVLPSIELSEQAISSPSTRVSQDQIIACYRRAMTLSRDPFFSYHAGLRFHVSTFGLYGFAILSSTDFRQSIRFALRYHELGMPSATMEFREEGENGIWTITPLPDPEIDARLYRFIVEMEFGIHVSLHRDVMGRAFAPTELHVTYAPAFEIARYREVFGCDVLFGRPDNELVFEAFWLDAVAKLGDRLAYASLLKLCRKLLDELQLSKGVPGQVRELLLVDLAKPIRLDAVARHLKMSERTLRRKLQDEHTSFQKLLDELRMHVAIRYLRDTDMNLDEIADALGLSDAANFRRAFVRWTKETPHRFREGFARAAPRAGAGRDLPHGRADPRRR